MAILSRRLFLHTSHMGGRESSTYICHQWINIPDEASASSDTSQCQTVNCQYVIGPLSINDVHDGELIISDETM